MSEKNRLTPCACFSHDETGGRLRIDIEMPGVKREDIQLEMRKNSVCLSAPKNENSEYASCFNLHHEIEPEKTKARYENGLLRISSPIKDWDNVTVHWQVAPALPLLLRGCVETQFRSRRL